MVFLALALLMSCNIMLGSDIGKMLVPRVKKQTFIVSHKQSSAHTSNAGITQFDAADCIAGGLLLPPIIGAGLNIARYYNIIPSEALLAQIDAKKADEIIVHYLKNNYLEKDFPFEKIYISGSIEGPAIFGKNNLLIPKSWQQEILAYNLNQKAKRLRNILPYLENNHLTKKELIAEGKKIEKIIQNPSVQALIQQEENQRSIRFQVILPHEGAHVQNKDCLTQSFVWLGALVPPAIAIACGFPDCMLDTIENLSMMSEIGIKTITMAWYYKAYRKGIVVPFIKHREKKADEAILNKQLGIKFFEAEAKKDNSESDTHPRNSDRAEYLKKIVAKETRNDI